MQMLVGTIFPLSGCDQLRKAGAKSMSCLVLLGFERPFPLAPPQRDDLIAMLAVHLLHEPEQRPVDRSAVVINEHIESGLDDEPAKFDEPARPLAALHDPVPHISPRPPRLQPALENAEPPLGA